VKAQIGLFAKRTNCCDFAGNQLRVLLAALAYVLVESSRVLASRGTELACAQIDSLRIRLLKLAAGSRATRAASACTWPPTGRSH
jgi:hypothetical protein